jgi:hypothetical protein
MELAGDGFGFGAGFGGNERTAVERRAPADHLVHPDNRRRSAEELYGAVVRPCRASGAAGKEERVCHG